MKRIVWLLPVIAFSTFALRQVTQTASSVIRGETVLGFRSLPVSKPLSIPNALSVL